jgi:hypothetical protein
MDDNTFECPNCGTKIYPEMTRCPQCGQIMYPEDEQVATPERESTSAGWGPMIGAILIGWLITCGIAIVIHFIIASFFSPSSLGVAGKVVLLLAGPVGALTGGYVAAGIVRQKVKWLGIIIGALALPVLALFATHWVEVTAGFLLSPWVITFGVLTILAGFAGSWLNAVIIQDASLKEKWQVRGWEDLLYQDLLRKVRFNGSTADRLIEYERLQDPNASRLKLIQSAIERWDKDNRY